VRDPGNVFHLAIPVLDLDATQQFYVDGLGCHLARRYEDRITLDFFGDQVVCHLSEDVDLEPELYPRHFGVTFRRREEFDAVLRCAELRKLPMFRECQTRFEGRVEQHLTFVLRDPSSNLLDFKHYFDLRMMY
jgi:extradiol dioxygenase family protein